MRESPLKVRESPLRGERIPAKGERIPAKGESLLIESHLSDNLASLHIGRRLEMSILVPDMDTKLVASISNAVVGMTGSLTQQQLVLSALGALDPMTTSKELNVQITNEKYSLIAKKYAKLTREQLVKVDTAITVEAIINFYEKQPELRTFVIGYEDFCNVWRKKNKRNAHKTVLDSCSSMVNACMTENYTVINGTGKEINRTLTFPLISSITIEGMDYIEIKLNAPFMPYLVKLNELFSELGYTKMPIKFLAWCKNKSTLSLMQLIIKRFWGNKGKKQTFTISVDNLKKECGLVGQYSEFKILRRDWLKPAIDSINEHDIEGERINVSFETIRRGRKVSELVFTIESNDLLAFKNKKLGNPEAENVKNLNKAKKALKVGG